MKSDEIPDAINSKYSSTVNIIVEAEDFNDAKRAADSFYYKLKDNNIDNAVYYMPDNTLEKAINYFRAHHNSFLTEKDRNNIIEDKTAAVIEDSIDFISTSLLPPAVSIERDPFSLTSRYVSSLTKTTSKWQIKDDVLWQKQNGINYIFINIPVDTTNINNLVTTVNKIKACLLGESENVHFHMSGSPVHTAGMYIRSKTEITVISVFACLSSLILIFLLFRQGKFIFIIALNLSIAFLSGFVSLLLFYNRIHILTFAFGSSLIGICIDYSFHKIYTMSQTEDSKVKKELTYSFITTLVCFIPLLFSSITLLKQISIFIIGGLIGTFLWVALLKIKYVSQNTDTKGFPVIKKKQALLLMASITIFTIAGLYGLNIKNDMSRFYNPDPELQKEEMLFYRLNDTALSRLLIIKGKNVEEILETEELLKSRYNINGLSSLLPSQKRQAENHVLIKKLYEKEAAHIQKEFGLSSLPVAGEKNIITVDDFIQVFGVKLFNQFMIKDDEYIWSIVPAIGNITELPDNVFLFAPKEKIKNALDECADETYISLIFSMLILFVLLLVLYRKKVFAYIFPSVLSVAGTIAIINTIYGAISFFHLISLFIVIGLSIDYTIFHLESSYTKNLKPVFFSLLSSVIGFGLLSIAGFDIISAMGQTIAIGLSLSYIISFTLIGCIHRKQ